MKKHELLIEAMKRYPFGTKFLSIAHKEKCISNGIFYFGAIDKENILTEVDSIGRYVYRAGKWAEIITEEKPKKIAVAITTEREYKLAQQHFKEKGFGFSDSMYSAWGKGIIYALYQKRTNWGLNKPDIQYTIVSFPDFAKEVGIRIPLLVSEDGFDLYEGDEYYNVWQNALNTKWNLGANVKLEFADACIKEPARFKAFHSKQSALKWIDEQNKPKEILLFQNSKPTMITKYGFSTEHYQKYSVDFTLEELEQIYNAIKSLK